MAVQVTSMPQAFDFEFNYNSSTTTTPFATAPSSPQSSIPFTWEEKPGIPKQNNFDHYYEQDLESDTDFAFGYLERHSISAADELFDCGKIKPLKPPPRLHSFTDSPKSPKSQKSRFKEALSPRSKKNDLDPFSEALKQTVGEHTERGRERTMEDNRRKVSRSLSPFRVVDHVNTQKTSTDQSSPTWYNKWNLKNLLLFRSASEGTRKDSLNKYTMLKKNETFSFRSSDSGGSVKVSAEEIDFTVAEEMKRKTTLPYKSAGLMSCLRFNQNGGSVDEISKGIKSLMK